MQLNRVRRFDRSESYKALKKWKNSGYGKVELFLFLFDTVRVARKVLFKFHCNRSNLSFNHMLYKIGQPVHISISININNINFVSEVNMVWFVIYFICLAFHLKMSYSTQNSDWKLKQVSEFWILILSLWLIFDEF